MALAAPMARACRMPCTPEDGTIETMVTSPPPAFSANWRPISTPKLSDSSMISLPSRLRVFEPGSS